LPGLDWDANQKYFVFHLFSHHCSAMPQRVPPNNKISHLEFESRIFGSLHTGKQLGLKIVALKGLPDGLFVGVFVGLGIENFGMFHGHLVYFAPSVYLLYGY
jgi:hypothetical protein